MAIYIYMSVDVDVECQKAGRTALFNLKNFKV